MTALLLALVAATTAADPCGPVTPAAAPDPAAAAAYRNIGEAERAAGSPDTATIAYRHALALDPSDERSRHALAELCRAAGPAPGAFDRGVALMDRGDLRGAVAAFEQARSVGPDRSAALLEGVCLYELRDDSAARPLLVEAEAAPAHRQTAELYLGLIALRSGESGQAATLLDAAAASPALAPVASDLARLARRSGKLVLSVVAESGWDSNAELAPAETPVATSMDAMFGITGTAVYRPTGESGPYLRAMGLYRQQARFTDLDYGGASAAAGWQLGTTARGLVGEYGYDYRVLGGASFVSAHHLLAGGWFSVGNVILGGSYLARFESYPADLYAPFSGTFQHVEATASIPLGNRALLLLAYRFGRDAVELSELSWIEHGPGAEVRYAVTPRLRIGGGAGFSLRDYDATDPLLGVKRSDTYVDGAAFLAWDVATRWTVRLSVDARDAISNATGFSYVRVVPVVGLAYVLGM